jgi:DNA-binding response OmpR family regulator
MSDRRPVVLMVEDDFEILNLNKKWLEKSGFETIFSRSLTETRIILETVSPDIVLLDVVLPDGDGLSFLPELKSLCAAPVLICSIRNEDKYILDGLEAGGDDYITKPYNVDILVARVNVMWRKEQKSRAEVREAMAAKTPGNELVSGPLKLDALSGRAFVNDRDAGLTPKEFALLLTLVLNEGKEISAKKLYEEVWGMPAEGDVRTVKVHISKIKRKLGIGDASAINILFGTAGYTLSKVTV